jgi:hypothetical protein
LTEEDDDGDVDNDDEDDDNHDDRIQPRSPSPLTSFTSWLC